MTEQVPTLSFTDADSDAFVRGIGAAYERYGFVIITDHGIPQTLIDRFLALYKTFFAWPDAEKKRFQIPGGGGARGYTPFGIETAKGSAHHDLKEFWHVGRELPPGHALERYMRANVWIGALPGFRELSLEMFEAFEPRMGRWMFGRAVEALDVFEDALFFEDGPFAVGPRG